MITPNQINSTLRRLEDEFRSNIDGPPTKIVSIVDPNAKAFGQHLSPESGQRGLHGTAAALYVFSSTSEGEDLPAIAGLVRYCENRISIEEQVGSDHRIPRTRLDADDVNVIKLAELLYGLSNASTRANTQPYARSLAEKLANGMAGPNGWSYQLSAPHSEPDLLPTSWATLALASHGYDVKAPLRYLEQQLDGDNSQTSDIAIKIFALYVLLQIERRSAHGGSRMRPLKKQFHRFFDTVDRLLDEEIETNIEYLWPPEGRVLYVRIPWQLHLIACASELSPYRGFARRRIQERLSSIVRQVSERGGIIYPHSGNKTSSRTNSILYESFRFIKGSLELRRLPLKPFVWWNRIFDWASSRIVRRGAQIFALALVSLSIWTWISSGDFGLTQTAPEFVAAFLLFLLSGRRR